MEVFKNPALPGIILFLVTVLALALANSGYSPEYSNFVYHKVSIGIMGYSLSKPFVIWVNEGLMALFFFHIGLEIKKERTSGVLKNNSDLLVPGFAAIGGMAVPAIIYFIISPAVYYSGWAIPTATDIAFSLAICSLLGKVVPRSFRMLLMSIAIFDDLGAVLVIAVFYTASLSVNALLLSGFFILLLGLLNKLNCKNLLCYLLVGFALWLSVVKSGVHATLAGFILAMLLPIEKVEPVEHAIHPWVNFIVMPLFALANAGVNLSNVSLSTITHPVTMGIIVGLVLGKPIGIYLGTKVAKSTKYSTKAIIALGSLCGVGFTMSLFIGTLAFEDTQSLVWVKLGVLLASFIMGTTGYCLLKNIYGVRNV